MIIIPIKWLFHWEYTLFSDKPRYSSHSLIFHATATGTTALRSQGDDLSRRSHRSGNRCQAPLQARHQAEGEGAAEDDAGAVVESHGLGTMVNYGELRPSGFNLARDFWWFLYKKIRGGSFKKHLAFHCQHPRKETPFRKNVANFGRSPYYYNVPLNGNRHLRRPAQPDCQRLQRHPPAQGHVRKVE